MGFRINTNIAALNAQRHLSNISGKLDKSLERLSSGLRINKASDDASGMATSVYLRGQIGGLLQASRNANDAISMTQTAEGALDVTTNILLRLRELAVQSATDTTNRSLLIEEANQLVAELTRVATDTEFVGNTLLNGSFQSGVIQVGANQGQTISFSIGDVRAAALGERATATVALDSGTTEGGFDYGEFTINATNVAATQSSDDQVSVLDLVGTTAARNFDMEYGAAVGPGGALAVSTVQITNGVSTATLSTLLEGSTLASMVAWINGAGLNGITAAASGADLKITAASGYDLGFRTSGVGVASFTSITNIDIAAAASQTWAVKMNDGGTAKISGLTINGETIATVSLAQGASRVSVATIASLTTVSNTDGAFLTAMIAAVNAQTNLTDVTARAGSATTMVKTLVLTADEGKDIEIGDIDGDTGWTAASFNTAVGLATTFYASSGDITTYNGQSSAMAKVAAIDSIKSTTEVDALVGAAVVTGTAAIGNVGIDAGDLYINGIDIGAVSVLDNDSSYALTAAINAKSATTGVVASVNTSSQMVLTASDGRNISVVAASDVETALNITSTVTRGSVTLNSNANFIVAGTTDDFGGATTAATYTTSLDDPVSLMDLSTQIGADSALATLDAAVTQVNTVRSQLGAIQSRISLTIVNLTTTAENLSASDSRIKDVDFAEETSVFTRNSILTQAATAILAQANQLPQLALQLLG